MNALYLVLAERSHQNPFGDCTEREYSLKTRSCISSFVRALQIQPKKHCRLVNVDILRFKRKEDPLGCCTRSTKCNLWDVFHDLVQGYSWENAVIVSKTVEFGEKMLQRRLLSNTPVFEPTRFQRHWILRLRVFSLFCIKLKRDSCCLHQGTDMKHWNSCLV